MFLMSCSSSSCSKAAHAQRIMHATPLSTYRRATERPILRPEPVINMAFLGQERLDLVGEYTSLWMAFVKLRLEWGGRYEKFSMLLSGTAERMRSFLRLESWRKWGIEKSVTFVVSREDEVQDRVCWRKKKKGFAYVVESLLKFNARIAIK